MLPSKKETIPLYLVRLLDSFSFPLGLVDWIPAFLKEKIDLDSLMLLTEQDLG